MIEFIDRCGTRRPWLEPCEFGLRAWMHANGGAGPKDERHKAPVEDRLKVVSRGVMNVSAREGCTAQRSCVHVSAVCGAGAWHSRMDVFGNTRKR